MDKARQAVSDFMSKAGHHDTSVHERVAPAVTHETVKPQRHENITTAVDREVHQDHYHTSVQPVTDRKVLPEQHAHKLVGVEHREFHHGNHRSDVENKERNKRDIEAKIAETAHQFKDKSVVAPTHETHTNVPVVTGEHIHHHVHEVIQPVVQRETIQPHVVHTTVPIHEVHHNAPQHHSVSTLPAVNMTSFEKQGGVLTGRDERLDNFAGEPKHIGTTLPGDNKLYHGQDHNTHTHGATTAAAAGGAAAVAGAGAAGHHHKRTGSASSSSSSSSDEEKGVKTGKHSRMHTAKHQGVVGSSPNGPGVTDDVTGTKKKASIWAKLDPRVDSNGDGKAGFMK